MHLSVICLSVCLSICLHTHLSIKPSHLFITPLDFRIATDGLSLLMLTHQVIAVVGRAPGLKPLVKCLVELNLNFVPKEDRVFTLDVPNGLREFYSPSGRGVCVRFPTLVTRPTGTRSMAFFHMLHMLQCLPARTWSMAFFSQVVLHLSHRLEPDPGSGILSSGDKRALHIELGLFLVSIRMWRHTRDP